jgi:hypothetical protein
MGANLSVTGEGTLITGANSTAILSTLKPETAFENRGTLRFAGASGGRLEPLSCRQTAAGTLTVRLGANELTSDKLSVRGAAGIAGTLALEWQPGTVPAVGQAWEVVVASAGVSGHFDSVIEPAVMPAGLSLRVSTLTNQVYVLVVPATPYETWVRSFAALTNSADRLSAADPDRDGLPNFLEFALAGNPAVPSSAAISPRLLTIGGAPAFTWTIPLRTGTVAATGAPPGPLLLTQTADALHYSVQATRDLATWNVAVSEVTGPAAETARQGLPAPAPGWEYRTFRCENGEKGYLRVGVSGE